MSIIRKPLGNKDGDLKYTFISFVTHVTCNFFKFGNMGPKTEMVIFLKLLLKCGIEIDNLN